MPVSDFPVFLSENDIFEDGFVVVTDDILFEGEVNEWFGVQLSLVPGDYDGRVTIQTSTIEIQIEDNDPRPGTYKLFCLLLYIKYSKYS